MSQVTRSPANEIGNVRAASNFFDRLKSQMSLALPKHMNADRMSRLALTAFSTNPKLFECTEKSIAGSIITASQLGLEIGVGGQGYLVPYGKTCTFIPGWQGLVDLANRAGRSSVWTGAVFEGDDLDWALGDSPFLKHIPKGENDPGKLMYAYAIGRVNGAEWPVIECWPVERLKKHRDKNNKVGNRHYSHQHWEMYCRKIPLLQVLKYMPKSIELTAAMHLANVTEQGDTAVTIDSNFVVIGDDQIADEPGDLQGSANGKSQEHSEAYLRWERTIKTEPDQEQRIRDAAEIEGDGALTANEKGLLVSMITTKQ